MWRRAARQAAATHPLPLPTAARKGAGVSDNATHHPERAEPTIAELLEGLQPMGDLDRLAIDDLTPEEADEFFRILEDA